MAFKPLIHDTIESFAVPGADGIWSSFDSNIDNFVKNIKTRTIDLSSDVGAIVSGVPSVFARTTLFRLAIEQGEGKSRSSQNLAAFYSSLLSEWKGFIACIALESQQVTVERIYMQYSDGKEDYETNNIYEPKGAFGNMLFGNKLWHEQDADSENRGVPFIDIIKYKNEVVGGTSPESMLFTSVAYKIDTNEKRPFVDGNTGKFIDPLDPSINHLELNAEQTARLISYVEHLIKNISKIENYYSIIEDRSVVPDFSKYVRIFEKWKFELQNFFAKKKFTSIASIPTVTCFKKAPYSLLFNHSDALYGLNGAIFDFNKDGRATEFSPKELLLPEEDTEVVRLSLPGLNVNDKFEKIAPVYYLRAERKSGSGYELFALPLSPMGLRVFGENLGQLLGYEGGTETNRTTLQAIYDDFSEELQVTISLRLSDSDRPPIPVTIKYKVADKLLRNKDVIIWPNFKAKNWTRYFMYSEIPHNVTQMDMPFRAFPFVGDRERTFHIIESVEQNTKYEPLFVAKDGICYYSDEQGGVKTKLHVMCTTDVYTNPYQYEIYESNMPFKGVKLMSGSQKEAGYLIIRYMDSVPDGASIAKNYSGTQQENTPKDVTLGIDFGSTNSSIAYAKADEKPQGFMLRNHRISLMPPEKKGLVAKENELLFFQAKDIMSNSVKSVLTLHDSRRLKREETEQRPLSIEVKGGFPCVESNLPVTEVGETTINLNFEQSIKELTQIFNMKWQQDVGSIDHMKAFLKTMLLQIYADLYTETKDEPLVIKKINWAYPAAMPKSQIRNYSSQIWNSLANLSPVLDENGDICGLVVSGVKDNGELPGGMTTMGEPGMGGGMSSMGGGMSSMGGGMSSMGGGMSSMGGGMSSIGGGMSGGQSLSEPDLRPSTSPIEFKFNVLKSEGCLTEACAVANYTSTKDNVDEIGSLTLCFDIGGSTSDISALCKMYSEKDGENISMVKQNSIHFAAQRVSSATKYSKSFKNVLLQICSNLSNQNEEIKNLHNRLKRSYSNDKAPYFFEQLINALDNNQLRDFYGLIRSQCPELMTINLYVTGLIMFYAGQMAGKLVRDLQNSVESRLGQFPLVIIRFAGKGARIFDWFINTDGETAQCYYNNVFLAGIGGLDTARTLIRDFKIFWPSYNAVSSQEIKYEVSYGLAFIASEVTRDVGMGGGMSSMGGMSGINSVGGSSNVQMMVPQTDVGLELVGESSFEVCYGNDTVPLKSTDTITPEMMKYIGSSYFKLSQAYFDNPCPEFWKFIDIFGAHAINYLGFKMSPPEFVNHCKNLSIVSFVKNLPDFKLSQRQGSYDYVAPIIILEGMKFYDDALIKIVKERYN